MKKFYKYSLTVQTMIITILVSIATVGIVSGIAYKNLRDRAISNSITQYELLMEHEEDKAFEIYDIFRDIEVSVFDDLNIEKEVERLSKEIKVLHVHDNKFGMDLHMMPTMGIIDWTAFAYALKNISFDGCFSLETMPPTKLSNDIFEDMCKLLFRIANEIIN